MTNKFQITYIRHKSKTLEGNFKVRNVSGKSINKFKMRKTFAVDNGGKIDSFDCKSLEKAKIRLQKFNLKNIEKAVYFDSEGIEHII